MMDDSEINDINGNELKVNTIDGKCSRCGLCCGMIIPFTKVEVDLIKEYVKEHNIQQPIIEN